MYVGKSTNERVVTQALARDIGMPKGSSIKTKSKLTKNKTYTLKQELMKGSKMDISILPYLKDERFWDSLKRQVFNLAKIQNVGEVLDPNYKANGS